MMTFLWPSAVLALGGWMLAAAVMTTLWLVQRRTRNAGIVDVGWTYLVAAIAGGAAWAGPGDGGRRALVAALFVPWGLRLGTHLLRDRVLGRPEDGRYATLRRAWGDRAERRLFWFFQAQAAAAVFFALPAILAATNPSPRLALVEWAGAGLWAAGFTGEWIADAQLARFRANPAHRGRTCQVGLWRWSRHPNYFFEWIMWLAYALVAAASPSGWLAVACPAVMLFLLFRVTGIPATEAQALLTRGDEYRAYQAATSAFVPWPPARHPR